jgi:uncharacterized protein YndB with AHSA1/START domain
VDLPVSREVCFAAVTDPVQYSRWLGVPVTIEDGHFSCTLEWGTQVRGRYEHVLAPSLIVMRWGFDDHRVPLPGDDLLAYLRIDQAGGGCRVEVHQLVDTAEQARFMEVAWAMVLGRLEQGVAGDADRPTRARQLRPKQHR